MHSENHCFRIIGDNSSFAFIRLLLKNTSSSGHNTLKGTWKSWIRFRRMFYDDNGLKDCGENCLYIFKTLSYVGRSRPFSVETLSRARPNWMKLNEVQVEYQEEFPDRKNY